MSNFDFDELDKAVADALGTNASSVSFNDTAGDLVTDSDNSATSDAARVDTPAVAPEEVKEAVTTPAVAAPKPATPPAARRSAGRFMDVVHPSSDMRTSSAPRMAFTPPTAKPAENTETLDLASEFENTSDLGWSKPVESPFLPDAKVEKRPLGAEVPTGAAAQVEPGEEELLLEAPDDPRLEATNMPDPIDFAAQNSALDLETEDTGALTEATPVMPIPDELPVEAAPVEELPEAPLPVAPMSEPTGPASITQQYEEKPSSQQESGAIYDTENYHQPVTDTAAKPHGAWTILWIILLVILGAGAGVAFYLFVLPLL